MRVCIVVVYPAASKPLLNIISDWEPGFFNRCIAYESFTDVANQTLCFWSWV